MMLFIDGIHGGIRYENVGYYVHSYESAFNLLTQLVVDDWLLEFALIVDNGDCMTLPVEAFDGQPTENHLLALEEQWNEALTAKPAPAQPICLCDLKDHYTQLDTYYGDLLAYLEKLISFQRTKLNELNSGQNRSSQSQLISHYQQLLENTLHYYNQTVGQQQQNWQRLQQILARDS
jgi:hypothetical protein